jgi:hypothetical protein
MKGIGLVRRMPELGGYRGGMTGLSFMWAIGMATVVAWITIIVGIMIATEIVTDTGMVPINPIP